MYEDKKWEILINVLVFVAINKNQEKSWINNLNWNIFTNT